LASILIMHPFLDIKGGGEVLVLKMAQALRELGHRVSLITSSIDRRGIESLFGEDLRSLELIEAPSKLSEVLAEVSGGRLNRLRRLMVVEKYYRENRDVIGEHDLVIDTQSNVPYLADIAYIHYPIVIYAEEAKSLHWRLYNSIVRLYARRFSSTPAGRVLANSTWTASMVFRAHHVVPDVVYPPVDVERFLKVSQKGEREKLVVTTSRFTAEKRLERIIDVVSAMRDYTFVIMGSTYAYSKGIVEMLERKARERGLDNVVIEPDASMEKQAEYYSRARYYLHPEFPEHFGIAVVEAIAAGVVPIVYRDGGAWHDVVSRVSDLLGYTSIAEAPSIVRALDGNPALYEELRFRSVEVAKQFTYDKFKEEIARHVNYVLRVKSIAEKRAGRASARR